MNLKRLYGITPEEYDAMRLAQDFRCPCCQMHENDIDLTKIGGRPSASGRVRDQSTALQVDHDHATGANRGLLCPGCNKGLSHFKDNAEALIAAAEYLRSDQPPVT